MGYRSDVKIAVALPSEQSRKEVMALYSMHPDVQQCDIATRWETYEQTYETVRFDQAHDGDGNMQYVSVPITRTAYLLAYQDDCVKWYEGYTDVQAVEYMFELLREMHNARKAESGDDADSYPFAYRFLRSGEEIGDVEVSSDYEGEIGSDFDEFLHEILHVNVEVIFDIKQDEAC